ncbi:MAG TPA: hypothetical protein PK752_03835 [Accumulibacter sp.]|uniref:hypothetical protein n=1 Tax=Accumulibacter sp. TaxID=2053492 RepID=UPI002B55CE90|nr:hypothetical protein [Accumulibacter sp.]HRD87379.1 hypothetical protein [Accumulibacter sp.]
MTAPRAVQWKNAVIVWDAGANGVGVCNVAVLDYREFTGSGRTFNDGATRPDWRTGTRRPCDVFDAMVDKGFRRSSDLSQAAIQFARIAGWGSDRGAASWYQPDRIDGQVEQRIKSLESENAALHRQLLMEEDLIQQLRAMAFAPASIAPDMLARLIRLCHPDKHGGSDASNVATSWLLQQRQASR